MDTGLGRGGVAPDEWPTTVDLLTRSTADRSVTLRTVMSHLAWADEPGHPGNDEQARCLDDCEHDLRRAAFARRECIWRT